MRQATVNDYPFFCLVAEACGVEPITKDKMETTIGFVGEHGYFIVDVQSETCGIAHVAILPQGRGKWANEFFAEFIRWAFTSTRLERLNAAIPRWARNVRMFASNAGFRVSHVTAAYTFMDIDILRWVSVDDMCLGDGKLIMGDYQLADIEMMKRITNACAMMHDAGMEHKAWYVYALYAKLFGYKVEV